MAESLAEMMDNLSIRRYSTLSQVWVHVTHINDPGDFYVRPTSYKDYLPRLNQFQGPVDPSKLQLGTNVVFKSESINDYVRGQVRNIRTKNGRRMYDLFTPDYGFHELSVPLGQLKKPLEDCPMPPLVLHCQLGDCNPKKNVFDKDAIEAMVYYVGKERAKMIILGKTGDKYVVRLINTCPDDIATLMALTGYTYYGYGNNSISRMPTVEQPKLYYKYKQLKVGDTLNVRVQSGDSLKGFYVCELEDYRAYMQELPNVRSYHKTERDFAPENLKRGQPLAVFTHEFSRYERAVVTDVIIPGKKATVQLVDWGTKMDIESDYLGGKVLSREYYFLMPAMAIYCRADEKQIWDNELYKFLYRGHEFVITVKELGHQLDKPNFVHISKK